MSKGKSGSFLQPRSITLILCFCIFGLTKVVAGEQPGCQGWTKQIAPDLSRSRTGISPLVHDPNRAGVVFLSNKRLITYWVDHEPHQLSSRVDPTHFSPFRLHAAVIDVASGQIAATKEWGTRVEDSAILPTITGLLVKTGSVVKLYSPDLSQAKPLPLVMDSSVRYYMNVSATGKTIVISHIVQEANTVFASHFDTFDARTLRIRYSWNQTPPLYFTFSVSDGRLSFGYGSTIAVQEFGSVNRKTVLDDSKSTCLADNPTQVTDDALVVAYCGRLLLWNDRRGFSSLGTIQGRLSNTPAVAQNGRFIAVSLDTFQTERHLFTESSSRRIATRLAVYDLILKKQVFSLPVTPLPNNDYDFALSPDGSRIALLNDRNVSLCAVPK